jgi:hypothetical protein
MIELLEQLSREAPEVCEQTVPFNGFRIGQYSFWFEPEFQAQTQQKLVTGDPAHDWLRGALETAIVARGWSLNTIQLTTHNGNNVIIANEFNSDWQPTMAQALLTALIAALRSEVAAGDAP